MQIDSNETSLDQPAQDIASGQSKRPSRKSTSPQSNPKKKTRANAQQKPGESTKVSEPSHALPTESTIDTGDSEVAASSKQKGKNAATGKKKFGTERGTRTNGNRSKSPTAEDANADAEISSKTLDQQVQTDNPPKATRSRRGPAKDSNNTESQSPSQGPVDPAPTVAGKRKPPAKKRTQPEPETNRYVDQEPEAESTQPNPRQGRSGKRSKRSLENNEAETREEEVPPEPEPTIVAESSKQRRGQSEKKAKRATRAEAASIQGQPDAEAEAEVEVEAETETSRRTQRKPREPRGETVPVTVHRLVNTSALTGIDTPDSDGEEGDRPADDPSAKQNAAKLPNPGGVNHADVLSQICRETLEKTLTSLKTGIENETNTARRAEWSRKRKAVEAYGMELDGRLFDLSELLDSNLVLGKQLKKAKREMMEMRSHLHRVRQKRERIALEMDQVRSEHMEKENEKTVSLFFGCFFCYTLNFSEAKQLTNDTI